MIKLQLPLSFRIKYAVLGALNRTLDLVYAPVLNRASDDEYFTSRTRNQVLAKFVRNRVVAVLTRMRGHGGGSAG